MSYRKTQRFPAALSTIVLLGRKDLLPAKRVGDPTLWLPPIKGEGKIYKASAGVWTTATCNSGNRTRYWSRSSVRTSSILCTGPPRSQDRGAAGRRRRRSPSKRGRLGNCMIFLRMLAEYCCIVHVSIRASSMKGSIPTYTVKLPVGWPAGSARRAQ